MNQPNAKPESSLEKAARTLRRANQAGAQATDRHAAAAQQEINRPEQAKARPKRDDGKSNAGNDGGA